MPGQMLDVLSVLDSNEEPVYSNCTLQMGENALEFKNGRSKVPEENAPEVLRDPNCLIPGYAGPAAPPVPNESMGLTADVRQHPQETPVEREARIAASEDYLRSQGLLVPAREPVFDEGAAPGGVVVKGLEARVEQLEQMLQEAVALNKPQGTREATAAEVPAAAEVEPESPASEVTVPDGIEPETEDGKPRCWARKGDGSQCSNPAVEDTHACNLKAHQAQ